jgi:hypothetical protein
MKMSLPLLVAALVVTCTSTDQRCERIAFAALYDENLDGQLSDRLMKKLDELPALAVRRHQMAGDTIPPRPSEMAWYNEHCWGFKGRQR